MIQLTKGGGYTQSAYNHTLLEEDYHTPFRLSSRLGLVYEYSLSGNDLFYFVANTIHLTISLQQDTACD